MGTVPSDQIAGEWKHEGIVLPTTESAESISSVESASSPPDWKRYFTLYVPLQKATFKGDWKAAEELLKNDVNLAKDRITVGGETALHIAAVEGHARFVEKLLTKMDPSDLEISNKKGSTALGFAAAAGHVRIAELMVQKNRNLLTIPSSNGVTPLYMAALQGHNQMAKYLFGEISTRHDQVAISIGEDQVAISIGEDQIASSVTEDQVALLMTAIDLGLYDLAISIVEQDRRLALVEDSNGETPLKVLARKPLAFCNNTQQGLWGSIASTMLPYMKKKTTTNNRSAQCDAWPLLAFLLDILVSRYDIKTTQVSKLFFVAAESGNDDFLVELIRRYPDFLYNMNNSKHSIFHVAVLHRHMQIFNLIYEIGGAKDLIATYIDEDGNNMLHLAAMLAPQNQLNGIPGAALQMQREILWYKEVEKIVQPWYRNMKNLDGQTPYELFLAQHKNLMIGGEKMMKQTAQSCMLVTIFITIVVFTTAFTVSGGYNINTGSPILQNQRLYIVFPISEAVATLSSFTSIFMFLSIFASRCSENDFLKSLPFWLVIGVAALFVSIVVMMVVFYTCLLFYQYGLVTITVVLIFFASVPLMFIILNYPVLDTVLQSTYGREQLFRSDNRLFS